MKIKAFAIKQKGGKAEPFTYERKVNKSDVLVGITHCIIAQGIKKTQPAISGIDQQPYGQEATFNDPDGNGWVLQQPASAA